MHDQKIAEYRAQAAECLARAELENNTSTASRWLKIAQEWTRMADHLEARLAPKDERGGN